MRGPITSIATARQPDSLNGTNFINPTTLWDKRPTNRKIKNQRYRDGDPLLDAAPLRDYIIDYAKPRHSDVKDIAELAGVSERAISRLWDQPTVTTVIADKVILGLSGSPQELYEMYPELTEAPVVLKRISKNPERHQKYKEIEKLYQKGFLQHQIGSVLNLTEPSVDSCIRQMRKLGGYNVDYRNNLSRISKVNEPTA